MNQEINQRIARIINNLLPITALDGKFGSPKNLYDRMKYYDTPGVSIAVINNYEIEWAQGFGVSNVRSNKKITTDTLFQAASISKAIFALGVMRLVQDGELSLDEDVNHYLSSWRVPANNDWQPAITLRQLLSHTAGLTVHGFPGYQSFQNLPTVPQILSGEGPSNTAKVEVNILPGTQFRYSGGGTTIAQQVLADLFNKPFPQIMHELVLAPLGMTNSTYAQPLPKQLVKKAATAYPWNSIPVKGRFHIYPEMAAAGLWSTATDLAKVGVELLKVLHAKTLPKLLSKEMIESMLLPQLDHQVVGGSEFVGLGFFCAGKNDSFYFGHSGRNEGFITDMRFYKNLGKGIVIMINSNKGSPLINEIMRAVAQEYYWPEFFPNEKKIVRLDDIQNYLGHYETKTGFQIRVGAENNNLVIEIAGQPPLLVYPISQVEFFTPILNIVVRFDLAVNQRVIALAINQKGYEIRADKR